MLVLTTPAWDGVVVLRRSPALDPLPGNGASAAEIRCNNDDNGDTHRAKIDMTLDPGTYYVVVDGRATGNAGAFSLDYHVVRSR